MGVPHPAVPDEAWSPEASDPAGRDARLDLPGYRDFVLVASGGDSMVYRARQQGLDRPVAVKVLTGEPDGATLAGPRFQRELEITTRLGRAHPHIVTVLDTQFTPDGRPCIVMEYHDLGSLHDQLRVHGPLPASAVVAAGTVVADALAYAHGQGVIHRDVKPQNILVLPTSYVLADFGLARRADAGHSASLERFSYRHAAPQVLDGELPTVADDIYSLGSTLFTLLDGRPPFASDDPEADTALAYLRRVRTEPPRRIRAGGAPPELLAIIGRCLAKRREDRYADAGSLRDALAAVVTEARVWSPQAPPEIRAAAAAPPTQAPPPIQAPATTPAAPTDPPPASTVEPPVLARSALEHIEDPAPVDAAPTGLRPEAEAEPEPSLASRPRWARVAVLAGVALVLGGVIGLGAPWVLGAFTPDEPTGPARPVQSFTGALPSAGTLTGADERLAPGLAPLDDRGDSIALRWTDPTGGRAVFVVIQVDGAQARPLLEVDPGQTSVVVNGLDPAAPRYCFQVLALDGDARGLSPLRCTGVRT
jgi:serine/threonine protein kinase